MQQQGINSFTYDNLMSFQSNAFQQRHWVNGAILRPMQHYPHIPFVQPQAMLHPMQHYPHIPFVQPQIAAQNYGAGAASTWHMHGSASGRKSFLVYFAPEEEATYLRRAKNLGVASKECRELTQEIVKDVNSHIANTKDMMASVSFERKSQRKSNAKTSRE